MLMPLLWMVFAAFKTRREIFTDPLGLPDTLSFDSFERAWGVGVGPSSSTRPFVTALSVGADRRRLRHGRLRAGAVRQPLDAGHLPLHRRGLRGAGDRRAGAALPDGFSRRLAQQPLRHRAALRRLRHPVHHHPVLRLLPRFPARAGRGSAARRLQPDADLLPRHRPAVRPGRGQRRDLPGSVHLERVPAGAADADPPGAEDPAGRHPATAGRVHLRLAGGDGGPRHGDGADPRRLHASRRNTSSGRWPAWANRSAAMPSLDDREHRQGLWRVPRHQGRQPCGRAGRVRRHGRALRLRQVHAAARHRRAGAASPRAACASTAATSPARSRRTAASPWCSRTTRSTRT